MNNAVRNTSIIETTKFGKPTVGETDEAPVSWLEQVVDPDDYTGAGDDIAGRVRADADELEGSRNYEGFVDDIAQNGVREPVRLTITADGQVQVIDGHHRIAAAREAGLTTVPVKVVRENAESGLDIRNGVNVKQHMAPGWHTGGKPAHSLYEDIRDNPQNYVFHATSRKNIGLIEQQGWRRGSVVPERAHAETYAAQHAEELGGDTAFIQIYRVEDLPSSVRGPIERGEPISTQIDELPPMPEASRIKPVAQYQVGEGFDAALGPQFVDDVKAYDMHEAFDTLPWQPEVVKELNLLHGGPNQSRIAGVSREVLDSVDDSKVIRWSQLEDVADTRKVAQKVNSSHYTDWAEEVPTPHYEQSSPIEARNYEWETHVDSNSIRHEAFKPEQLDEAGAARQKVMREKEKARKATRAKDRKALSKGEEIPRLRVSSRKHSHPQGAVLRFMPYENLTAKERQNVWRAAHEWLDRAFQEKGVFDGQFTDQGIQDIINSGLDDYTAEVLHSYVHTKLGSLGRDAIEYIAKEPAEVFETRKLFDDWVRGMNQFIHANAAVRTSDGKLIADPDKIAIAGGPEVREELARLKRAALKLGSRGYDEAVAVMQDVEAYTGVQSLKGYVNPEAFNLGGPAIKDMTVEMNVAEWLSLTAKNMGTIYTPEGVAAAKLAANETLKWWRAMATLPRPAFHIRNLVGGSWMNMNFGVKSKTMAKASRYGLAFRKALGEATGPEGIEQAFERLPKEMRNAWRAAWDHNVLAGFATTEFSNAVTPRGARARWDWAKAWDIDNFALTRAGGKVMESVEDFLRMSLFLEYYDEAIPGSAKTAADIVNAVHFDYSNLTPTETKLKSIIPFFVWTRRNLPLQIQTAVENPRYVQRYRAMLQSMNDNLGGDDPENLQEADYYSAYAAGTSYKVNPNTPFWARVMIDPDLPISDLLSIPNPEPGALVEYANNVLGPHISLISDLNGQREFGNVNAPAPFNTVLQGLAAVGMYDRTLDGDVRIPYYMRTLLETAVPLSREIADPITGGPTDPSRQQRYGITPDDNFAEAGAKSLAAQLAGGFGIKLTTPADARAKAFRSDAELDQIIRELQLGGQAPPVQP